MKENQYHQNTRELKKMIILFSSREIEIKRIVIRCQMLILQGGRTMIVGEREGEDRLVVRRQERLRGKRKRSIKNH